MKEKTTKKTYEITNTVKTYIAEDGKEFNDMNKCKTYENELFLNRCADKYKMKFIDVPSFICDDDYANGISFYFPQDGDVNEVTRLLSIYQNYQINKDCDKWEVGFLRKTNHVRDSDFEIKIPFELNKGDNYIFYYRWERYDNDWDYFYNRVVSKKDAIATLKEEIKSFEEIFGTKFE
jgi:hypothetical protein